MDTGVARVGSVPLGTVASRHREGAEADAREGGLGHLREGEARRRARLRAAPGAEGLAEQDRRVPVHPRPGRVRDRLRGDCARAGRSTRRSSRRARSRSGSLPGPDLSKIVLDGLAGGCRVQAHDVPVREQLHRRADARPLRRRATRARRSAQAASRCATRARGSRSPSRTRSSPTPAAAPQQALAEVASVAKACARKPVVLSSGTVTETYKVAPLTDPKLPAGSVVVKLQITATDGKKKVSQTGVAVYQVRGQHAVGRLHVRRQGHDVRRRAADRVPRGRAEHAQPRRRRARRRSSGRRRRTRAGRR